MTTEGTQPVFPGTASSAASPSTQTSSGTSSAKATRATTLRERAAAVPTRERGQRTTPRRSTPPHLNENRARTSSQTPAANAKTPWLSAQRERQLYLIMCVVAFVMRVWDVGRKAMMHDESLHALYSWKMTAGQGYFYDPMMHGPLQFHMYATLMDIFGSSEAVGRLGPVLCGTALVVTPYLLRRQLGRYVSLILAVLLCVSPITMYVSRFMREDMAFALLTVLAIVGLFRFIERGPHHYRWLYLFFGSLALAYATFEAVFFDFAILGGFIGLLLVFDLFFAESSRRPRMLIPALQTTPWPTWILAAMMCVVFIFGLYLPISPVNGPSYPWQMAFLPSGHAGIGGVPSYNVDALTGGLSYWRSQQGVARGGQPWEYYFLLIPLYDQVAVVFGLIGLYVCLKRGTLFYGFIVWWVITSFLSFGWASEKMPWLSLHQDVPLLFAAAVAITHLVVNRPCTIKWAIAVAALAITGVTTVRGTQALAYVNSDNRNEMMVYVQSSPDVPKVVYWVNKLAGPVSTGGTGQGNNMHISADGYDAYDWPMSWYYRFYHYIDNGWSGDPTSFATAGNTSIAMTVSSTNFPLIEQYLGNRYVGEKMVFNWWFPQNYIASAGENQISHLITAATSTPFLSNLFQWWLVRRPFNMSDYATADDEHFSNARIMWFLVRKDYAALLENDPNPDLRAHLGPLPQLAQPPAPEVIPQGLLKSVTPALTMGRGAPGAAANDASLFNSPQDVATDSKGNMYVVDSGNNKLYKFGSDGSLLRTWGGQGAGLGQFNAPNGVAVDGQNNVYVADTWNGRVQKFDSNGHFLLKWGANNPANGGISSAPGGFWGPRSIAVAPNGNVYVADTGNKRIQVFTSTGTFVKIIGSSGSTNGLFNEPSGIAVDGSGNLYVADYWNRRIQKFDNNGQYVTQWPVNGWQQGSYKEAYLTTDGQGNVYASDPLTGHVLKYSPTGQLLAAFGSLGGGSGQFNQVQGMSFTPQGQLVVVDPGNTRMQTFTVQ